MVVEKIKFHCERGIFLHELLIACTERSRSVHCSLFIAHCYISTIIKAILNKEQALTLKSNSTVGTTF